ncbi:MULTISPECIES: WXG100 family type VII secretion target [unclassified Mycobacterium]|uniref:WXG100 family type VII secretion target n=1 Tax=unclassified Mycobacterium TaxID=2642494 RepID=UPI002740670B|nr:MULTISPECIES: WXG100 family type VII secretion target [unclassified Mycobacterium]MDP7702269.1 WXG100 family type VII secretion target [Mycobacterium sp. TY815]MDP7720767.1 WXG100 family type VII secretion target [Mycobacterium sp. TY814]
MANNDDTFTVDLDALDALIEHLARFTSATDSAVEHVDAFVAQMPWEGATEQAHKQFHALWRSGVDELQEGLRKIREGAQVAHANYSGAANTNVTMWGD